MTERYKVAVELSLDVVVRNDSSSEKLIAEYAENHIKKLLVYNYEMAHNRNIRAVKVEFCAAELVK